MNLTIAYITYRQTPRIEWFYESLASILPEWLKPKLVVVDALHGQRHLPHVPDRLKERLSDFVVTAPKPSAWQGEHKLTSVDFHSCSNPRNTALCHTPDTAGYIAYCDDLSVLMPSWITPVIEAFPNGKIVCGSFMKVNNLVVEDGNVSSHKDDPTGHDYRWGIGEDSRDVPCDCRYLLGCTSAIPVQALLDVNGWPEYLCDGLGFEDCMAGLVMGNFGHRFVYSRRMHEYESQENHFDQHVFPRIDPGTDPNDKSHKVRDICASLKRFEQGYGNGIMDISELRNYIKRGNSFPIPTEVTHEWFTGIPLKEFHNYKD